MANVMVTEDKVAQLLEDIRKPALPLFASNWIFGLGIIEYPFGTQHRLISFLYTTSIMVIYCSLAVNGHPFLISMTKELKTNSNMINILFFSQVFLCISTTILGWYRSEGMHQMLRRVATADYMLELIGIPKDYVQVFKTQIKKVSGFFLFVLIVVIIHSISVMTADSTESGKIVAIIAMNYPIIMVFIVDTAFMNIIDYVRIKIKKLNDHLKNNCTATKDYPQHAKVARSFSKVYRTKTNLSGQHITADNAYLIYTAKKAHLEYVKTCRDADNTYGLHIILSLTIAIGIVTGELHHIYVLLRYTTISGEELSRVFASNGIWIVYYMCKVLMYCYSCSAVTEESTKTGEIIAVFYDETTINEETKSEIRDFHMQLVQNVLEFNAHGFITINVALLQSIIGVITTYLVILIQLGNFSLPSD